LTKHLERTKALHQVFRARGYGEVELPYTLERKYQDARARAHEEVTMYTKARYNG
jgi:hypothetical protein